MQNGRGESAHHWLKLGGVESAAWPATQLPLPLLLPQQQQLPLLLLPPFAACCHRSCCQLLSLPLPCPCLP
jgi:hypothetical protein